MSPAHKQALPPLASPAPLAERWHWVLLAVTVGVLVIGIPYWSSSFAEVKDDGIISQLGVVFVALMVIGAVLTATASATVPVAFAAMCMPVPFVVLGRVVLDVAQDSTSHNLWPLEVVVGVVISVLPAAAGAFGGSMIRRGLGRITI